MANEESSKASNTTNVIKEQSVSTAAKVVGARVGSAVGTAMAGPLGTAAGQLVGRAAGQLASSGVSLLAKSKGVISDIGKGAVALPAILLMGALSLLATGVAALGSAVLGAFIGVPLIVAFILTIINNSAYVVPPSSGSISGGYYGPGIDFGATCPIPGGVIFIGSYGTPLTRFGHGENEYWNNVAGSCGDYTLSGCYAKQPGDYCYSAAGSCPTYGLAIDVRYPSGGSAGRAAYLPFIKNQQATWQLASVNQRCNCAGTMRTVVDGDVYEMYISHLTTPPRAGVSGDVVGIMDASAHVHIEMRINGQWVNPESMCSNSGDPTGGGTSPVACAVLNGDCLNVPSCGQAGRSPVNGTCADGVSVCCSRQNSNTTCESNGGFCRSPEALGLLTSTLQPVETCEDVPAYESAPGTCSANQLCCRTRQ